MFYIQACLRSRYFLHPRFVALAKQALPKKGYEVLEAISRQK